jgi:hypothetical protein
MKITQLAEELYRVKLDIKVREEAMRELKLQKDKLQLDLMEAMRNEDLKSIKLLFKTGLANFARTIKKDIRVTDESAVIADLAKRKQKSNYVHEKVDVLAFKAYAKSLLRETGEVVDGIELTEKEYIAVKAVK